MQDFAFAFLSILLEGAPFILLGTLLSGFIDVYLPSGAIERFLPRNKIAAILVSGLLGIFLPVCECAVVPVIRRLVKKGLPVSCGLTYMLAAPIVNPITALSTFKAFNGQSPLYMMSSRLFLGYLVAIIVGLIILRLPIKKILQPGIAPEPQDPGHDHEPHHHESAPHPKNRITLALRSALKDFVDVGVYFSIGITITAMFNTQISLDAPLIEGIASNTYAGPAGLMALSFLLSLCSTSDAFIAATLHKFGYAARLAFLVFGPMMDVKLLFLYSTVLRKKFILFLALGLFFGIGGLTILRVSLFPPDVPPPTAPAFAR
jgi:uncharacterized membrane protein YraQ (UPF0718 family)